MGKSTPKPPDPIKTASAQTATNVGTAIANQIGAQVNQVTPDGSLTYGQTGTFEWKDPLDGRVYKLPQFTATQALDPISAKTDTINKQAGQNLATLGRDQSARLQELLSEPVSLDNDETEARLIELGQKRLDPMLDRRAQSTRDRLAQSGIGIGSEAYSREMERLSQAENDAYNSLLLSGRGQAIQERLTERNQPINEITALLSGSQVSQPNFMNTPGLNMPTTDYAGIMQQDYANRVGAAQQKNAGMQSIMGGLFGLGAGALSGAGAAGGFGNLLKW